MSDLAYTWGGPDAPTYDSKHDAVGDLAVIIRDINGLAAGRAAQWVDAFVKVADNGGDGE